jgi:hypothetical protein
MTLSAIAKADGTVSRETIRTAIDEPVCKNLQTETPVRITGKDGKSYPAKKPRQREHTYIHDNDVKKVLALPEDQQKTVCFIR